MTPAQPHPQRFPIHTVKVSLASLLCLATVSYVDYVTGYEFLFFVFYFIPVGLCGWYLGRLATFNLAVLSGVCWFLVDVLSDHHYSYEVIRYWNSFTCFLAFAIVGFAVHHLKRSRDKEQKSRRELEKALAELQDSRERFGNCKANCRWYALGRSVFASKVSGLPWMSSLPANSTLESVTGFLPRPWPESNRS